MKKEDCYEVYDYLPEGNFENIESLMIDIETDQVLGEDAFAIEALMQNINARQKLKKQRKKIRPIENPTNPIRICDTAKIIKRSTR